MALVLHDCPDSGYEFEMQVSGGGAAGRGVAACCFDMLRMLI